MMNVLDDRALKAEIEEISQRIDNIIKNVNQYHPIVLKEEPPENSTEQTLSE